MLIWIILALVVLFIVFWLLKAIRLFVKLMFVVSMIIAVGGILLIGFAYYQGQQLSSQLEDEPYVMFYIGEHIQGIVQMTTPATVVGLDDIDVLDEDKLRVEVDIDTFVDVTTLAEEHYETRVYQMYDVFFEQVDQGGQLFLLGEYSKGTLRFVPEPFTFSLVKRIPLFSYLVDKSWLWGVAGVESE